MKNFFKAILPALLLCLLCGCSLPGDEAASSAPPEEQSSVAGQVVIDRQLSVLAAASEQNSYKERDMVQISLYFAAHDGGGLVRETRMIPKEEGIARATVQELIIGPDDDELASALPSGTVLKDINIRDGLCTVDFNSALKDGLGTREAEKLCVYSIVNTLSQFPSVDEVKILVEGRATQTLAGALDISSTLAPDMSFVLQ